MDFKSLMAAQIAKSKPPTSKSVTESQASSTNKYLRRAEVEAAREAAYAAEQAKLEAEREERAAKKRKVEEEEAERDAIREEKKRKFAEESKRRREEQETEEERKRRKRLGLPDLPTTSETDADGEDGGDQDLGENVPDDELRSRLRDLDQPAAFFDETHAARLKRYYTLVKRQKALAATPKLSSGPVPTTLELVEEKDMRLPTTVPTEGAEEWVFLHRQLASYFTLLLTEWAAALDAREAAVKKSSTGQAAAASYRQVVADLTPLFRQLERRTVPATLLSPIVDILRAAQDRRYVDANDGYLTLSIGKAAWPIGVTMVGIHERSAREKLHGGGAQQAAHIMSDEVTRKILQSIKRCLSFAQTRWPPHDLGQLMG